MLTLLTILTSASYIAIIYYAFSACTLTKAFGIVSGSTTAIACAVVGLVKFDPQTLTQNNLSYRTFPPYIIDNPLKLEPEIDYLSVINSKDVSLLDIQTRQWSEGNFLWVLDGTLKNNSQFPINSLKLELMLSDCGPKNTKEKCLSSPRSIFIEVLDLNIRPHEKGQFSSTYVVQDPNHLYQLKTSFVSANSIVKNLLANNTKTTNRKNLGANVDSMIICGGGTSVDQPEYDKRIIGKTMIAKNRENHEQRLGGC